jgi:hypothetical protein
MYVKLKGGQFAMYEFFIQIVKGRVCVCSVMSGLLLGFSTTDLYL